MAEQAAGCIATHGYVIKDWKGRYLSRKLVWVKHRKGVTHAFVHPLHVVLRDGGWKIDAKFLTPAVYDPVSNNTVITGEECEFAEFCRLFAAV